MDIAPGRPWHGYVLAAPRRPQHEPPTGPWALQPVAPQAVAPARPALAISENAQTDEKGTSRRTRAEARVRDIRKNASYGNEKTTSRRSAARTVLLWLWCRSGYSRSVQNSAMRPTPWAYCTTTPYHTATLIQNMWRKSAGDLQHIRMFPSKSRAPREMAELCPLNRRGTLGDSFAYRMSTARPAKAHRPTQVNQALCAEGPTCWTNVKCFPNL